MLGKLVKRRYQVVQILGAGGLCQTYLAQDTDRPGYPTCFVKHFKAASNHPESVQTLRRLFTREAQALKKLGQYDQVPKLLADFEEDQEFYLVQEFIAGHPLSTELLPNYRWTESQVVQMLQEVLSILKFVHSHGLIHRDIKPSHLIRRQQDSRLVLIDFSSVKLVWTQVVTAQGQTSSTNAIGMPATIGIGTPGYMSAEQGRGRPRPNSDIYALGMVGIQALLGLNPTQLLEDADTGEIIWQDKALVSTALASVLNQMIRYHFNNRYQSATEALQALQPLVANLQPPQQPPVVHRQPSTQQKVQPSVTITEVSQAPPSEQDTISVFQGNRSKPQLGSHTIDASVPTPPNKSGLLINMAMGLASALALMIGSYYYVRPTAPASQVQQYPVSIPLKNTALGNISLANTLAGHTGSVWSIALGSNGQTLVSGSSDKTIKVWNLDTGQLLRTLSRHSDTIRSVTLSSDGQTLVSGSGDKTIKIWNLQTGKLLRTLSGHSGPVWSVALSRDGQTLVSGSEDNTIKIWNLQTGELRHTLFGHSGQVFSVALSPDGQTLVTGGIDKTIKIWNLQTGELRRTLFGHSDSVRFVTISPDGQTLASSSWDKTIKIWNLATGKLLQTLEGHTNRVVGVAFSPDGQTLVSASTDKTIKIWALWTGKLLHNLSGHSDWVLSVAITPSGSTLVSSSKDKSIKIWRK